MISSILLAVLLVSGSICAPLDTQLGSTAPSTSVKMTNPIGSDYRFTYSVYDENTGDIKSHRESRKNDVVEGRYELIEPDGFKRIVVYTADAEHGFVATVLREPTDIVVPIYESKHYKPSLKEKPIRVDSNVEFTFPASSPSLKDAEHLVAQAIPPKPADSATSADSSKTDNLEIQEMASSENLDPQKLQNLQTETDSSEAESTEKSITPSVADSQEASSTEASKEAATTEAASFDDTSVEAEVQETTSTTVTVEENKAVSFATKEEPKVATESNISTILPNSPLQILVEDAGSAEPEEKTSTLSAENESTTVSEALDLPKESELKNDDAAQLPVTPVTSTGIDSEVASEVLNATKDAPTENENRTENDSQTGIDTPEVSNAVEAESERGEPTEEADNTTTEREAEELMYEGVENRTAVASEPDTLGSKVEKESSKGDPESSVVDETEATTVPTHSNELSNTDEVKQVSLTTTEPKEDSSTEQSHQRNEINNTERAERLSSTTTENLLLPTESKEESSTDPSPQRNELNTTEPTEQASSTTMESLPSPTEKKEESSTEPSTTPRETSTAKQMEDIVTPATDPAAVATVVMEILKENEEKKYDESLKVARELSKRRRHISPRFRLKF